jgi:hypothetical protein
MVSREWEVVSILGWFKRPPQRLEPEVKWIVAHDVDFIQVTDLEGQNSKVAKSELSGVVIETNDSGPWGADVWWMLFGAEDQLACAFPQGATGEEAVLDYLMSLPGFDHAEMINAMSSTENAVFPVWRKR